MRFAGTPRSRPAAAMAAGLATAILLSACATSNQFTYVGTSTDRTYFKVPTGWTRYNKQQLLVATGLDASPESQSSFRWLVAYDGDPKPDIQHILGLGQKLEHPAVMAWVRQLNLQDHDSFSLATIRNSIYPVDQLLTNHQADIVNLKDITLKDGVHGLKVIYNISIGGNFAVTSGNAIFRVAQIGLLDPSTKLFYLFILRCSADCYKSNQSLIDQIVNSWTVKET